MPQTTPKLKRPHHRRKSKRLPKEALSPAKRYWRNEKIKSLLFLLPAVLSKFPTRYHDEVASAAMLAFSHVVERWEKLKRRQKRYWIPRHDPRTRARAVAFAIRAAQRRLKRISKWDKSAGMREFTPRNNPSGARRMEIDPSWRSHIDSQSPGITVDEIWNSVKRTLKGNRRARAVIWQSFHNHVSTHSVARLLGITTNQVNNIKRDALARIMPVLLGMARGANGYGRPLN